MSKYCWITDLLWQPFFLLKDISLIIHRLLYTTWLNFWSDEAINMLFLLGTAWKRVTPLRKHQLPAFVWTRHLNPILSLSVVLGYGFSLLRRLQCKWTRLRLPLLHIFMKHSLPCPRLPNTTWSYLQNPGNPVAHCNAEIVVLLWAQCHSHIFSTCASHFGSFPKKCSAYVTLLKVLVPQTGSQTSVDKPLQTVSGLSHCMKVGLMHSRHRGLILSDSCNHRAEFKRLWDQVDSVEAVHHQFSYQHCISWDTFFSERRA